jgi:hypothetical protein
VLLAIAGDIRAADRTMSSILTDDAIRGATDSIPDSLLESSAIKADFDSPEKARARYAEYLITRRAEPRAFVDEAIAAQERARKMPALRVSSRR